jgi:hypothetical protein
LARSQAEKTGWGMYRVFRAQSDWTFIFIVGTSCERAAPLAEEKCRRAASRTEKSDKLAQ